MKEIKAISVFIGKVKTVPVKTDMRRGMATSQGDGAQIQSLGTVHPKRYFHRLPTARMYEQRVVPIRDVPQLKAPSAIRPEGGRVIIYGECGPGMHRSRHSRGGSRSRLTFECTDHLAGRGWQNAVTN